MSLNIPNRIDRNAPTEAQLKYCKDLLGKLGYEIEEYNLEGKTKKQVSELITELKEEYEG